MKTYSVIAEGFLLFLKGPYWGSWFGDVLSWPRFYVFSSDFPMKYVDGTFK
jgi:hypothetical protein